VRHGILDARAGIPIMIFFADGTSPPAIVLAAEAATAAGRAAFHAARRGDPLLALAPSRADALATPGPGSLGARPGQPDALAFRLPPAQITAASLQALADPSRPQPGSGVTLAPAPVPALAEAAMALAKLARLLPAMLIAEADPAGALTALSDRDIAAFQRDATASLVRVAEAALPLAEASDARIVAYRPEDGGMEHVALLIGHPERATADGLAPLVRIHSECFTGDLLGSLRCDCGPQLHQAIARMAAEGAGVLLYMAQEGRGIGLVNKLRAYALQDRGLDTLDANRALGWGADERDFTAAAMMLRDLGIPRVRLLTNNPDKVAALDAAGIIVDGRLRHAIAANGVNDGYLETKARRFGHLLG
jgi:GTP cyclohydrolase II